MADKYQRNLGWCEEGRTYCDVSEKAYKQGREDAIDEAIAYFEIHAHEVYNHILARDFICDRLEQLKE